MIREAQITVRNVGLLLAQRNFHIAGNFLFAALVPRLLGPGNYGRYALITSLAIWFALFSHLGITQVMGRFVPQFRMQGDQKDLKKLFNNLLTVNLAGGALASGLYLLFTVFWLRDLNLPLLTTMAAAILVRAFAHPFFALFLGLNQAARWGMAEIFHRWFSIVFLLSGFYLGGLQGACLGLLLTDLSILFIGFWWGRSYFSWSDMRLDTHFIAPFLRFGLIFFMINLVLTAFQHSGEVLVRFFYSDYIQVAYFGLAYNVYLTISSAIPQFTWAFAPLMTALLTKGETGSLKQWTEHLIKWLAVGGVWVVYGVLLLGNDLVPLILGGAYKPVTTNLLPLSLALLASALGNVATLLTLVYNCPRVALVAGGIRLATFWCLGIPFVIWWGSLGGCVAVLAASTLYAAYFSWRMQRVISYSLGKWALAIGLGGIFFPLVWLRSSGVINFVLYGIFSLSYACLLLSLRIITVGELTRVWKAMGPGRQTSDMELHER